MILSYRLRLHRVGVPIVLRVAGSKYIIRNGYTTNPFFLPFMSRDRSRYARPALR